MTYEELQIQNDTLNIQEMCLSDISGLKGFCIDGNIAIKQDMNSTEKACILAEELGHYHTTVGNILDQSSVSNRKQELRARAWAYDKMIGMLGIIDAYKRGCRSRHEIAEYLDVTEEFLTEALQYYKNKFGICNQIDNYVIYFEPSLGVFELI